MTRPKANKIRVDNTDNFDSRYIKNNASYYYIGDPDVDGSWRILVSSDNLTFQRRETGVWVEKSAVTP
jgi:hypothetical protein